jgi:hypothetical protein
MQVQAQDQITPRGLNIVDGQVNMSLQGREAVKRLPQKCSG